LVVREPEDNRATREHYQRKRSLGGMEPVRAAGDEPDLVVECLDPSVVDPKVDRSQDAVVVLADRAGEVTNGSRRLRLAMAHQRSSSSAASLAARSPANTARSASLSPSARQAARPGGAARAG
jgi:hypothetical protein